ncbi:hypothetical protein [Paenibacillus silviterrae]|uniref:hypothetical protein n=1 Tax=Paenibacillus silviterrae TaxID=3242194 RepID=UPI002543C6BB|nr:hypothetical protein [Paenibacillus chinjuensis]
MKEYEIWNLFEQIVLYYPYFTGDEVKAVAWHKAMKDVPYEVAYENLIRHVTIDKKAPTIADLSAPLEPEKDRVSRYHDALKQRSQDYFQFISDSEKKAVGPTEEQRRKVREMCGRNGVSFTQEHRG